ncbi:30S ribosomal protein S17 [Armatimonas rosea]|uniref:Small ribosomal subunit protein uS17 n=1 Tax=Armatimonas rosea TaxID=685828 RepID=A0A7W9W7W8_ARMRO|nr:30S ribosomal protein S17 [Armatimonas rosea]MBB6051047.1 small subunit ribosomal protein S17 [Armatimonas rosea]
MAEETVTEATKRGYRKTRQGVVTSDAMDKTIVVTITTLKPHPLYGRTLRRSRAFKAHDETNDAHTGDTVEIMECRPISKEKCWRLVRVIERAK